jgi:hypothetical protein
MWRAIVRLVPCAIIFIAFVSPETHAETRRILATEDSWSLYVVEGYEVAVGGRHVTIDGACVAEVTYGQRKLAFATFPKTANEGTDQYAGIVIMQATSPEWEYKVHNSSVTLASAFELTVLDTLYDDDMIMFNQGGYGQSPAELQVFAELATEIIYLIDDKRRTLAVFPADGLGAIYPKLMACGGINER